MSINNPAFYGNSAEKPQKNTCKLLLTGVFSI